jgi:hemolysin activation/secretion protein
MNMEYEVDKEVHPLGIEGEGNTMGITLSHPLIKERAKNLSWIASIKRKDFTNYLLDKTYKSSHDKYAIFQAGIEGDRIDGPCRTFLGFTSTFGLGDWFDGMSKDDYTSSSRIQADGDWVKFNLDLSRIRKIGKCQLLSRVSGQWASDNLLTSEQMVIGGPNSVRAYPTGEYQGDLGYFAGAELRTPLLPGDHNINKYANWAVFLDHAGAYYKTTLSGEDKRHTLTGVGAGIRVHIPCHFDLRFDAAFPVTGPDATDDNNTRYWLQTVLDF